MYQKHCISLFIWNRKSIKSINTFIQIFPNCEWMLSEWVCLLYIPFLILVSLCTTQSLSSSCSLVPEPYVSSTGGDGVTQRTIRFLSMVIIVDDVALAHAYVGWRRPPAHSSVICYCLVRHWADVAALLGRTSCWIQQQIHLNRLWKVVEEFMGGLTGLTEDRLRQVS